MCTRYLIDEMQTHPHTHVKPNKSPQTDNEDKVDRPTQFRRRTGIYTLPRRISSGYIPVECAPTSIPAPINGSNRLHPDRPASGLAVPNDTFSDGYDSSPDDHTVVQDDDEDEERPRMSRRRSSASAPSIHGSAGSKSLSTTIGLIAHSLADGISLGASSSASLSSSSGVSLYVSLSFCCPTKPLNAFEITQRRCGLSRHHHPQSTRCIRTHLCTSRRRVVPLQNPPSTHRLLPCCSNRRHCMLFHPRRYS